ncbi:hypothetical protein GSI_01518 [Ganoderma sinense ZZ0214-1]|uniref:Uncharacterized protein n=1 Tax=Ganoderma sinense ZZ0214-1 TaxID=1077348 RepID=A0A2G8SQK7_9APHY|nr:hypothetical protein GSI_01518 [Ganoderma sinense ZZ0214-1]
MPEATGGWTTGTAAEDVFRFFAGGASPCGSGEPLAGRLRPAVLLAVDEAVTSTFGAGGAAACFGLGDFRMNVGAAHTVGSWREGCEDGGGSSEGEAGDALRLSEADAPSRSRCLPLDTAVRCVDDSSIVATFAASWGRLGPSTPFFLRFVARS